MLLIIVVTCGVPPSVQHGVVGDIQGFSLGQKITYQCMSGYRIAGVDFVTCLVSGEWSYTPLCYQGESQVFHSYNEIIRPHCGCKPVQKLKLQAIVTTFTSSTFDFV